MPKFLAAKGYQLVCEFIPYLIHRVMIASWRTGNPLAGKGLPLHLGSHRGREEPPALFLDGFSFYSKFFEGLRNSSGWLSRHSRFVKNTAQLADYILPGIGRRSRWWLIEEDIVTVRRIAGGFSCFKR